LGFTKKKTPGRHRMEKKKSVTRKNRKKKCEPRKNRSEIETKHESEKGLRQR